jgi:hypothetical protein
MEKMKKIYHYIAITALLVLVNAQYGCKKDWLDVNYNPRELTNTAATPDLILPPLLEEPASFPADFEVTAMWMGYWASPTAQPGTDVTTYNNIGAGNYPSSGIFFLEDKAAAAGEDFYTGIAKVLRALAWSRLVDKLNKVPYSEAYQASILHPKYDDGQAIYEDLMKQLTLASTLIKNADLAHNPRLNVADIMFHGDRLKWLQFINCLKLRLLIHQANLPARSSYIAAEIQVIKSEGSGFLPSGVDAAVNPGYSFTALQSPYYRLYSSDNSHGGGRGNIFTGTSSTDFAHANVYALNALKADNDPRIGFIYSSTNMPFPAGGPEPFVQPAPSSYRGSILGFAVNTFAYPYQNNQYISAVGGSKNSLISDNVTGIIKGSDMDAWVMTSVENYFLQAEAIFRGWLPGDPESAYKDALRESFRWLNTGGTRSNPALSDAVFNQWYTSTSSANNPRINWTLASDKYKLLMTQKFNSLNGIDPIETWTDYRRNGRFPDLPVSSDPAKRGATIPLRMAYSLSEYQTNTVNVKALGDINMFTDKIWWMP